MNTSYFLIIISCKAIKCKQQTTEKFPLSLAKPSPEHVLMVSCNQFQIRNLNAKTVKSTRRILTAVTQSDQKRLAGCPHTSWLATMKNYLSDLQPQCVRCHQSGTGQATPQIIGCKQSYALKWCKPNNDDDGDQKLTLTRAAVRTGRTVLHLIGCRSRSIHIRFLLSLCNVLLVSNPLVSKPVIHLNKWKKNA